MSIQIDWDNEAHTVLIHTYQGNWSKQDFLTTVDETVAILDRTDHKIDIIVDLEHSAVLPAGITTQFTTIRRLFSHPQLNRVVVAGGNRLIQTFTQMFVQTAPGIKNKIHVAANAEEARTLLDSYNQPTH